VEAPARGAVSTGGADGAKPPSASGLLPLLLLLRLPLRLLPRLLLRLPMCLVLRELLGVLQRLLLRLAKHIPKPKATSAMTSLKTAFRDHNSAMQLHHFHMHALQPTHVVQYNW
jgi:hypothetical protein